MAPVRRPEKKCPHGRLRRRCRDCDGSSVCKHGRERHRCRDCGGASVCVHWRLRRQCRDCCNFVCEIQGCPRQDLPFSSAPNLLRHMQTMHGDNPRAATKSKELEVRQALRDAQIAFPPALPWLRVGVGDGPRLHPVANAGLLHSILCPTQDCPGLPENCLTLGAA